MVYTKKPEQKHKLLITLVTVRIYLCTFRFMSCCVYLIFPGLDSLSEWLKAKPTNSISEESQYNIPSPSSSPSSTPGVSQTKDRLLHSEIRELQVKLAQLEKENHELRQLLKASGDDPRAALLGRQVQIHIYIVATNYSTAWALL